MKNKSSGFSLIELLIVLAIIAILGTVVLIPVLTRSSGNHTYGATYGANGMTETRCINGLMFVVGQAGSVQQIIGESGGGISCK